MAHDDASIRHLLRRAGFGASAQELELFDNLRPVERVNLLTEFDQVPDDVDEKIGEAGYVGIVNRGTFHTNIADARQRWLFRMVHSKRPLQEKLTLFWHNHFATAYSKIAGAYGSSDGARLMAAKPSEDPKGLEGQLETIRRLCAGNFTELVVAMAKDPAMLIWLDGRYNTKAKPQENFGRELMELFSMGVQYYTESDVYAAARVFTGWNLSRTTSGTGDTFPAYTFVYNASAHESTAKTFSFPIYPDGSRTIPARSADAGLQDGIDLITAVTSHPETARRLVRRLWGFFVSEFAEPDAGFVEEVADAFIAHDRDLHVLMRRILRSSEFWDPSSYCARYAWPVETVVRAIKEVGWTSYALSDAVSQLSNMGQILYEPPDVAGWELGAGWVSSGAMLARMNFASALAVSQRSALQAASKPHAQSPEVFLAYFEDRLAPQALGSATREDLLAYLRGSGTWTGSDTQVRTKAAGLVHLMLGSGEYVFV
jgi:uncharacterized protein (DUF1800 family)